MFPWNKQQFPILCRLVVLVMPWKSSQKPNKNTQADDHGFTPAIQGLDYLLHTADYE